MVGMIDSGCQCPSCLQANVSDIGDPQLIDCCGRLDVLQPTLLQGLPPAALAFRPDKSWVLRPATTILAHFSFNLRGLLAMLVWIS